MNPDVEKTKIMDGLTQAFEAATNLKREMLIYLIDMALTEARLAHYGEKKRPMRMDDDPERDWDV